jgi:hypothetical protein
MLIVRVPQAAGLRRPFWKLARILIDEAIKGHWVDTKNKSSTISLEMLTSNNLNVLALLQTTNILRLLD